jgi:hypothetical protein
MLMVIYMMDAEERRVAFAKAVERSRLMLDADSCRETIVAETVTRAIHRDDGYSSDWAAGMPRREPAPAPRSLGTAEIEKLIDRRINTALRILSLVAFPRGCTFMLQTTRSCVFRSVLEFSSRNRVPYINVL